MKYAKVALKGRGEGTEEELSVSTPRCLYNWHLLSRRSEAPARIADIRCMEYEVKLCLDAISWEEDGVIHCGRWIPERNYGIDFALQNVRGRCFAGNRAAVGVIVRMGRPVRNNKINSKVHERVPRIERCLFPRAFVKRCNTMRNHVLCVYLLCRYMFDVNKNYPQRARFMVPNIFKCKTVQLQRVLCFPELILSTDFVSINVIQQNIFYKIV